jgi:hypothetical protein
MARRVVRWTRSYSKWQGCLRLLPTEAHFRPKFEGSAKFATKDLCDKCCFDPSYRLEERASSILDWERQHIERVAAENGLKITQVWDQGYTGGEMAETGWYSSSFEAVVAINEDDGYDVMDGDEWAGIPEIGQGAGSTGGGAHAL